MNNLIIFVILFCASCGFTVTNSISEEPEESLEEIAQVILAELDQLNETIYNINGVTISNFRLNIGMKNAIVAANLGDGTIHISTWPSLKDEQQELIKTWFGEENIEQKYADFFYKLLTVSQGMKQYVFEVLTTPWIMDNMALFFVEEETLRATISYYIYKNDEVVGAASKLCESLIEVYGPEYGSNFNPTFFFDNLVTLIDNLRDPSGYMYFVCRFIMQGIELKHYFPLELEYLSLWPEYFGIEGPSDSNRQIPK